MFILIVSNGYPTKEYKRGIFALDQAKALKAAGHKVALVALDLRSIRRRRALGYSRLSVEGIDVFSVSIPLGKVAGGLSDNVAKSALRSAYKKAVAELGTPDVIHAHFYDMGIAAGALSQETGIPLVITEHFSGLNRDEISAGLRERAVKSYEKAKALIAVSGSFADKLKNNFDLSFRIVPNVADTGAYSGVCRRDREENSPFRFISVGNLVPIKGFGDLLEAFREASDRAGTDLELTIVGKGPERETLEQKARDLGIADKVHFTGQLDRREIAELFAESDCFVLLSKAETFGVAYIEAMAAGLPVIATACGGPNDFVDGENGMLVPVGDREAYVKALLHMSVHAGEYDAENIREKVLSGFSPEKIADDLVHIYEEAIGKHGVK